MGHTRRQRKPLNSAGISLIEVMIAVAIMSLGMLGFIAAFSQITKGVKHAKGRTLAANPLTLEKLEVMRRVPYHKLMVSTATVTETIAGYGDITYDVAAYPEETVVVGDIPYIRRVLVEKVQSVGNAFQGLASSSDDLGVKRLRVYTLWMEEGAWKMYEASTIYTNPNLKPLRGVIQGTVTGLANVQVTALQDPAYYGISATGGGYAFSVPAGSYTLRANLIGYFPSYSGLLNVPSGATVTQDFTLSAKGYGTVTGSVWLTPRLLVSKVVVSTTHAGCDQEFIELFNPSTWTWTIASATQTAVIDVVTVKNAGGAIEVLDLTYPNGVIASKGFYLVANKDTVYVNGSSRTADAYLDSNNCTSKLDGFQAGGAGIRWVAGGEYIDRLSWSNSGVGNNSTLTEGTAVSVPGGMYPEDQLARRIEPAVFNTTYGPAYDTNVNSNDFQSYLSPGFNVPYTPNTSAEGTKSVVSGFPAWGAVISADDGLSSAVQAAWTGTPSFSLASVATGTWQVGLTSGTYYLPVTNVTVTNAVTTAVRNAATQPAWDAAGYNVTQLTSTITSGFISGTIRNSAQAALSGVVVSASGVTATSDATGKYTLTLATGTHTVDANPSSAVGCNNSYVSVSSGGWLAETGRITTGVDFTLSGGGGIKGRITNNGTDPLVGVAVIASSDGNERGFASSDSAGYFEIRNISTGSYNVIPQIDTGESVSPSSPTVSLTGSGVTVWSATFTLTGSPGTITGTVKTSAGASIKTGVLLVATTGSISAGPPTNNSSLRSGGLIYYTASSLSDGTYDLEVRGG
ncbi:MAG: prepilin-type N-terminal cleavage/methylation domain-containing protein, partial [Elusimicrobia bacterium]|nr:prepilin-type N-terminal cleavage/methylation domain-containing protein [Elusimicrobiota bacterium]